MGQQQKATSIHKQVPELANLAYNLRLRSQQRQVRFAHEPDQIFREVLQNNTNDQRGSANNGWFKPALFVGQLRGLACATAMVGRAARGDRDQVRPLTSEDEDLLPIEPRRGRVSEPIRPRGPCPLSSKPASSIESSRRRASSSQKLRMHQIQHCMSDCTSRRQQVVAAVCSAIAGGRPA